MTTEEGNKEMFDDYKEMVYKYAIGQLIVDIRKEEDGTWFFDTKNLEDNTYVIAGNFDNSVIKTAFEDFDFKEVDQEGEWEIQTLLKYHKGDYDEPSWMEILLTECNFIQTFEDREKWNKELDDMKLF